MDFSLPAETRALRDEVRAVIAESFTDEDRRAAHETGTNACPDLYRALGDRGVIARGVVGIGAGDAIDSLVPASGGGIPTTLRDGDDVGGGGEPCTEEQAKVSWHPRGELPAWASRWLNGQRLAATDAGDEDENGCDQRTKMDDDGAGR
jgi:hypothetical protein